MKYLLILLFSLNVNSAILTGMSGSIFATSTQAVFLGISDLEASSVVSADAYFSDSANWKFISFIYSNGSQTRRLSFDKNLPGKNFIFGQSAENGAFDFQGIKIVDAFDKTLNLVRADIANPASYDLTITGGYIPPPSGFLWDVFFNDIASTGSGELHRTTGDDDWRHVAARSTPITGDFVFTANYHLVYSGGDFIQRGIIELGIRKTPLASASSTDTVNAPAAALYLHDCTITWRDDISGGGNDGTYCSSGTPYTGDQDIEISRVGSNLVFKINGVTKITYSYSGDVYPVGMLYEGSGLSKINYVTLP